MSSESRNRRLSWVSMDDVKKTFHREPYPQRGHRGDLGPLLRSISRVGMINPIVARVKLGKLEVICGYRRWLAAQAAHLDEIPVMICKLNDEEAEMIFNEEAQQVEALIEKPSEEQEASAIDMSVRGSVDQPMAVADHNSRVLSQNEIDDLIEAFNEGPAEEEMLVKVEEARAQLGELYRKVQFDRKICPDKVESLSEMLQALAPVENGFDIRAVGYADEERGDVVDRLASHSIRVALLAQHFAGACSWSDDGIRHLGMAGLVHDIGMLSIPSHWYDNAYPLTQSRRKGMQAHTQIGMEILQRSSQRFDELSVIARDHHERWDGSGYPIGKEGRSVALASRLIGLLDSYCALISKRPHRSAFWMGEAIRILTDGSKLGIYEPSLVKQFTGILTACPIGFMGKLADGRRGVVRSVDLKKEEGHCFEIFKSENDWTLSGDSIWLKEADLLSQAVELSFDSPVRIESTSPKVEQDIDEAETPVESNRAFEEIESADVILIN